MSSGSGTVRKLRNDIPFEESEDRARVPVAPEPGPTAEPCNFEIITTRAGFDALAADWNALFDRAGRGEQAFQAFNWNWHWCNHYLREGRGQQLAVVTGRRAGRLVMVWPLVTRRGAGLVQLSWMGDPVSQYGDVLIDNGTDPLPQLRAAWALIIASIKPDLVWLPRVREDAAIAPLLAELGAFCALRRTAMFARREDAEDAAPSRNRRRSMAKNLAKLGSVDFVQQAGNAAARALALETIAWKRGQLLERGLISPALADPRFDAFFADIASDAQRPAGCRVVALECNGSAAAACIVVTCKNYIAGHVAAFDPRFEKASVGMTMLERAIAEAFTEGFATFDLLAPADAYKARLTRNKIGVNDWALPVTLKGKAYARLYLGGLRPAIRSALAALPAPLARFLAARYGRSSPLS
jgi:CelD/BcsL family acetyltransferase involved in cellulose biosynthesis